MITAPGVIELSHTGIPRPGLHELLVRTAWSCVSPGTEVRVFQGKEPDLPQSPFIPGYALTGTVIEVGDQCRVAVGSRVFCSGTQRADVPLCWGGHTEYAVVNQSSVVPIPEGLDLRVASAAKLAAIAYHGVRMSQPKPGQTVAVVGLGPIGLLSALLHALSGARVLATDLSENRRKTASGLGIQTVEPAESLQATFADKLEGGADIVVEATGVPAVMSECAQLLRGKPWDNESYPSARLLIQASYAHAPALPYREIFMAEAAILVPRDCQLSDIGVVLELMAAGKLPIGACIRDAGAPERAVAVYRQLSSRQVEHITDAFCWL